MFKPLLTGAFLGLMALQTGQQPPEDYPGQRDHAMPPKGWYCSADAKVVAHKCACKRMMQSTPEDPLCEDMPMPESPQCKVWCHAERCLCPVECKMPEHRHPEQIGKESK